MVGQVNDFEIDDRHSMDWETDGMLPAASLPERALIRTLAIANRRHLDLVPLVQALAYEFPGNYGQRLMQLASALAAGVPVVDAVQQTGGVLDRSTVMALRLANDSARLPQMYDALLAARTATSEEAGTHGRSGGADFARIVAGFFFAWMILTFLMLFILPTFEFLFEEFGLTLPAGTLLLISMSKVIPLIFGLGILVVMAFLAVGGGAIRASIQRSLSPLAIVHPLVSSSRNLRSLLAIVAQSGRPIASGLLTLARHHHAPGTRARLTNACERIEQGQEPWGSLAAERLISQREALALSTSGSGRTQAWLLGWSVTARRNRSMNRTQIFAKTISFGCTFVFGFVIAWTVIFMFMPLVGLISGLS
jgi:type II secretory pathway component PulF